jgi:hypothetical protein
MLNKKSIRTEGSGFSAGPTEASYVAILLSAIFGLFVCNGFAKHVPWLLISCLTYFLCNLGSKYNGRICPGFINSKSGATYEASVGPAENPLPSVRQSDEFKKL